MRLLELHLPDYRGLRDFQLDLTDPSELVVLIGRNGRGKSRILHALVEIFSSLRRREPAAFPYKIRYRKLDTIVTATQTDRTAAPTMVRIAGGIAGDVDLPELWQLNLPDHVFAYQALARSAWDTALDRYENEDLRSLRGNAADAAVPLRLRPIQGCRVEQLPLVLIALAPLWSDRFRPFARESVRIDRVVSADLTLRRPPWYRDSHHGQLPYWGLSNGVAGLLAEVAASGRFGRVPDDGVPGTVYEEFRIDLTTEDDFAALLEIAGSDKSLFAALECLRVAHVLTADVRVESISGSLLRSDDLSAGEQQILTTLGMVRLQRDSESLFLLDEPNAHFHPEWSQRWPDLVRDVLGDGQLSQFLAATHDPLLVANIPREQIRLLRDSGGTIVAETPETDPQGRGIGGILISELYGLATHLDLATQRLLDDQYELLGSNSLDRQGQARLAQVTTELDELDFATAHRDPTISAFLAELDRRRRHLIELAREGQRSERSLADEARRLFDERFQGL